MPTPTGVRYALLAVALLLLAAPSLAPAKDRQLTSLPKERRPGSLPGERVRGEALERVDEMIHWVADQRMPDGGWHSEPRYAMDRQLRIDWYLRRRHPASDVGTTALIGVTLLRTRDAGGRTPYHEILRETIEYVNDVVDASPASLLELDGKPTRIGVRLGSYIDTALALLLIAEASEPRTPTNAGMNGPRIEKLIKKLEANQNAEGNWGDHAYNSPLLGHALAVWALESASRKGHRVDPGVLALAATWALGDESEDLERASAGTWKRIEPGLFPKWIEFNGVDDEEPVNHEMYATAARLSVMAQADRSNQRLRTQLLLTARTAGEAVKRAEAARSLAAIERTRATLEEAQAKVLGLLTEKRAAAPLAITAEDFLACLLLVDSLPPATAERWFPATVKGMMRWQDFDGGIRTDQHIDCTAATDEQFPQLPPPTDLARCPCERYLWKGAGGRGRKGPMAVASKMKELRAEARRGQAGKAKEPSIDRQFCPWYASFCSRDRVFCTTLAVATILADTPYKPAMLRGVAAPRKEP